MERLFSTRASGLEVICFGSVMACGAARVWDVARTGIVIIIVITTTITNRLRMRMVPRVGVVNRESLSVSMLVESRAPVDPLAKAIESASRSVVGLGRAFVFLESVAAVNDEQLSGDVGSGFGGEKHDSSCDFVGAAGATDGSIFT